MSDTPCTLATPALHSTTWSLEPQKEGLTCHTYSFDFVSRYCSESPSQSQLSEQGGCSCQERANQLPETGYPRPGLGKGTASAAPEWN